MIEGFSPTGRELPLRGRIFTTLVNQKVGLFESTTFTPPNPSKDLLDALGRAYDEYRIYQRMSENPGEFVRIDWFTHIPYMMDLKRYTRTSQCRREYNITSDRQGRRTAGILPEWQFRSSRAICNIEITPQVLGTLPLSVRQRVIDYIYNEQLALTSAKEETIARTAISGLNARQAATAVFAPSLRTLRDQQKQKSYEELKAAAEQSLENVAKKAGTTSAKLVGSAALRQTTKGVARAIQSTTPFGLVSSAIQASVGPLLSAIAGNISKGIADSEGWECPSGYVEGGNITQDNGVFTAINDFFPNPLTDITNSALSSISCVRYKDGKVDTALRSRCFPNLLVSPPRFCYAPLPEKMVAVDAPVKAATCPLDREIGGKLQLAANWLTTETLRATDQPEFVIINRFSFLCNPSEWFVECVFNASLYSKTPSQYIANERLKGSPDTYRARFYFTKNNCTYTVFGYLATKLDFMDQFGCGEPFEYTPTEPIAALLFKNAIRLNNTNPAKYAIDNLNNTTLVNQTVKENEERVKKEQEERKKRQDLILNLNPSNTPAITTSLETRSTPELEERVSLYAKYPFDKSDVNLHASSIETLRQRQKEMDEKTKLVETLNPSKERELSTLLFALSLQELQKRVTEKPERDRLFAFLNPNKVRTLQLELESLSTPELRVREVVKKNRDTQIAFLNPQNLASLREELDKLDDTALSLRYNDKLERVSLYTYLNPSGSENFNISVLDKISTADLKERVNLIKSLAPKDINEIQSLNALDIAVLRTRVQSQAGSRDEVNTFFNPDNSIGVRFTLESRPVSFLVERMNLIKQTNKKDDLRFRRLWLSDQWTLDQLKQQVEYDKALNALPTGHDCLKPWRQRTNCPATWKY